MRWLSATILVGALIMGLVFLFRPLAFEVGGNAQDGTDGFVKSSLRAFAEKLVGIVEPNVLKETINVLILARAGDGWTAGELTDTILLAVLDGEHERGTLFSIPRDLLVEYRNGWRAKINTLWQNGKIEAEWNGVDDVWEKSALIRTEVEEITGIAVNEVIVVDVAAVETVVDALGGIAIDVQEHLIDTRYPTPGGGIERFEIKPGFQILDGATAVKYARTRRTREGDFGRIRRQHQVIEAIVSKARGLRLAEDFTTIVSVLESLGKHVETTLSLEDIAQLFTLSNVIEFSSVKTYALESFRAKRPQGELPVLVGADRSYALQPRAGFENYEEIHEIVQELLTD